MSTTEKSAHEKRFTLNIFGVSAAVIAIIEIKSISKKHFSLYNELSMDSKQAGWLTQKRLYIISFQIVEQIVVVFFKF
jgi:hypothetical protein